MSKAAFAIVAILSIALAGPSLAQTKSKAAPSTRPAQTNTQGAQASAPVPQLIYSPWTKACNTDADGKPVCFTISAGRVESGELVVAAIVRERGGEKNPTLRAVVPLTMQIAPGTRTIVDSNPPQQAPYAFCNETGCAADYDDANLLRQMRSGQTLFIQAIKIDGQDVTLNVPLNEFNRAISATAQSWSALDDRQRTVLDSILAMEKAAAGVVSDSAAAIAVTSEWQKVCSKGTEAGAKNICFVGREGRTESLAPLTALVAIEVEGESRKILRATVPLGQNLPIGTRLAVDGKDPVIGSFVVCLPNGCMADYDLTPAMLTSLGTGRTVTVDSFNVANKLIHHELPLAGFRRAYDGPATDPKVYEEQQRRLQSELQARANAAREFGGRSTPTSSTPVTTTPPPATAPVASVPAAPPATTPVAPPTQIASAPANPQPMIVAPTGRRIALVIGNSAYRNVPALPNPQRDAAMVADALKKTGFQSVTLLNNLDREALLKAMRDFAQQAEEADWAMVYFAGHGVEIGGTNYLLPVDAKMASDRDAEYEAMTLNQVRNAVERAKGLRLIVLDACRDNPFASQMKRSITVASRSVTRGLAAIEPRAGTLIVYAAKDGEVALDGTGGNSPFASAFVKNLQVPNLEVRRLFDNVRDDVLDATEQKQQPFSYGSLSGRQDFYFVAAK